MSDVGRQFLVGGLAPLAGLAFGSALASIWILATGLASMSLSWSEKLFGLPMIFSGILGALGWALLYAVWHQRLSMLSKVIVIGAFVGSAGLTGFGGVLDHQAM